MANTELKMCVNDPSWCVEMAQERLMCNGCPGCEAQAKLDEKDRWNIGFYCMGNGITVCNRVGRGDWPMVAHIRFNREVTVYRPIPDKVMDSIRRMAASSEHIPNGELHSVEKTPPPLRPEDVKIIKKY